VVTTIEGDRDLRPAKWLNRVPEHQVDIAVMQLGAVPEGWSTGAFKDDVDHPFFLLKGAG